MFLKKYEGEDPTGPSNLARLVRGGADRVAQELLNLLSNDKVNDMLDDMPLQDAHEYQQFYKTL
eukprot:2236432-Pyramimonas_sp.AAC.1